jgi:hypothetical protein
MGKQGSEKGDKDQFVFQSGTFRSAACDPYGFGSGAYNAIPEGEAIQLVVSERLSRSSLAHPFLI